jgi:lipopolysaccharide export system protein LptC
MVEIAARIEPGVGRRSTGPADAMRRSKAFAAAARHSTRVRVLRLALLGGSVGAVALLIAIALFDPFGRLANGVSIGGIGVDGTKVTMAHPKLAGFRRDGRPYLVTAQEAVQDALHPTLVELHGIAADIATAGDGMAHMTAKSGVYDSTKEHMDVSDDVEVKNPQYSAWLKSASIDFQSGHYVSHEPVTILINGGTTLSGDAMTAEDNGKELVIEGHVTTVIPPSPPSDETKARVKSVNP